MILVMFKLLIFSIDNLHLFRQQTQKFNFLIFVVYGPRPSTSGQTYRARYPRAGIDPPAGRCRWPIGSPSWTLPVADRIPQLAAAGGRSDPPAGRCRWPIDPPSGRCRWPIDPPSGRNSCPLLPAAGGRSAGGNGPGPPDIGSENHDFKRKNAIRATRPPGRRGGG